MERTKIKGMGRLWRLIFTLAVCLAAAIGLKLYIDRFLSSSSSSSLIGAEGG